MPTGIYLRTEEHKRKIGKANKGKKCSKETKNKMSNAQKGKHLSNETKKRLSKAHRGKKLSENHKRKISKALKEHFAKHIIEEHPCWKGGEKASYRRRKKESDYLINSRMKTRIRCSLKGKNGSKSGQRIFDILGYTINELKNHLRKTLPDGCFWNDFLNGDLHIDHKIPISAFNFDSFEHIDFKKCWALSNLQLLTKKDNRKKWYKLNKDFQPSFKI